MNVVNQLREFGETRRGWLVYGSSPSGRYRESLKMELPRGALVSGIIEGGPITKGEIKPGDIIIRFDGNGYRGNSRSHAHGRARARSARRSMWSLSATARSRPLA